VEVSSNSSHLGASPHGWWPGGGAVVERRQSSAMLGIKSDFRVVQPVVKQNISPPPWFGRTSSVVKGKVRPTKGHEATHKERRQNSALISTLGGGGWLTPHPGKGPVPILQEAGWAPQPVRTGAENLAPTGIQ
jgi:hypothetical protein